MDDLGIAQSFVCAAGWQIMIGGLKVTASACALATDLEPLESPNGEFALVARDSQGPLFRFVAQRVK